MRGAARLLLGLLLVGPVPSGAAPPALEEREISWQEAQEAGATFPEPSVDAAAAGCRATTAVARSGGVLFSLRCPGALGTRSSHPAFGGVRLKNGWKVKDTRVVVTGTARAGFDLEKPVPGSDLPFLRGTLWAGPGGEVLIEAYVRVVGPSGTSCYR